MTLKKCDMYRNPAVTSCVFSCRKADAVVARGGRTAAVWPLRKAQRKTLT